MAITAGTNLVRGEPDRAHDAGVQRSIGVMRSQSTGKREANISDFAAGSAPPINANQVFGGKFPGGLLDRFPGHCRNNRLVGFQMPGRLIEQQSTLGVFLHKEKPAVALHHRRNGDLGFPDLVGLQTNLGNNSINPR